MIAPDRNARRIMDWYDALPPEWRGLVADYNLKSVRLAKQRGMSVAKTRASLEALRVKAQWRPLKPPDMHDRTGRLRRMVDGFNTWMASREA